ncbi:MAG: DUF190 domain-containing protein [Thermoleophilia bacterium]
MLNYLVIGLGGFAGAVSRYIVAPWIGIAGVSVFRGVSGYGADLVLHSSKMLDLSTNLPLKIEAVDAEERLDAVLPEICEVVEKGLVEISDTVVIRSDASREVTP